MNERASQHQPEDPAGVTGALHNAELSVVAAEPAIDSLIVDVMARSPFPGLSILIERDGQVWYRKGFGSANLENCVATTADHVFNIGSVSKSMTSLCLMQLVRAGKASLDDGISTYLDDIPADKVDIRLHHLLNHTSGLKNYTDEPDFSEDSQKSFSRSDVLRFFIDRPLDFVPGTQWSYCNSGLFLVALVVEKITAMAFDDYLRANVFEPFGMVSSSSRGWREIVKRRASGYQSGVAGLANAPRFDPVAALGAGGVMTTVDDLIKYRKSLFGSESIVPIDIQSRMLERRHLPDGTQLPYTLGCLIDGKFEGRRKLAHTGTISGYASQFAYYPDDDVTIILLTNNDRATILPVSLEQKIARTVLGMPQPQIADLPLDAATARVFTGDFALFNFFSGFKGLGYVFDDGRLKARVGGTGSNTPLLPLKWQGGVEFVSALDDEQRVTFAPSGDCVQLDFSGGVLMARRQPPNDFSPLARTP
jgi:D-alanyl-D-alanine carboxypeptidase